MFQITISGTPMCIFSILPQKPARHRYNPYLEFIVIIDGETHVESEMRFHLGVPAQKALPELPVVEAAEVLSAEDDS